MRTLCCAVLCYRTVEVYDPQRGSWQALAAQLTNERKYCAAASVGGRLLVLGGMNEARRRWVCADCWAVFSPCCLQNWVGRVCVAAVAPVDRCHSATR